MSTTRHERGAGDADAVSTPEIRGFELGPFATNCYVVTPAAGGSAPTAGTPCWIVDAGFDIGELIDEVRRRGLVPQALILTHAHVDHIAGAGEVARSFPGLGVWMHGAEAAWMSNPALNLSAVLGGSVTGPAPTRLLDEGDVLTLGTDRWRVLHTPGHSPGGVSLVHDESGTAITGDALFSGSIGRTDFPGSDHETLLASIRSKLYTLPETTRFHPGHGPPSTIGREKRSNPFVRG